MLRLLQRAGVLIHVIGGVGIRVDGEFPPADVARSDEPAEIVLALTATRFDGPFAGPGERTSEQDSWCSFLDDKVVSLCSKEPRPTPHEAMRVELSRDTLDGRYLFGADAWPYPFRYPMDQLLMVHTLGIAGGALMHAASIVGRDGALLVAGHSGAGKTTLSRAAAAEGAHILSDERTVVRPSPRGWMVGGTPWPGEGGFAENRSVPLRGIILLEQADRDELVPLTPARALAMLYRCHFPPLWDPRACERTLGNLEALVRTLPAFLYRNRKGRDAALRLLERIGGVA